MIDPEIIRLVEKCCTLKNILVTMFVFTLIFLFCAILTEGSGVFLGYNLKYWTAAFSFTTALAALVLAMWWGIKHDLGLEKKRGC